MFSVRIAFLRYFLTKEIAASKVLQKWTMCCCIQFALPRCSDSNLTATTCFCCQCGAVPGTPEDRKQKRQVDALYESDNLRFCMMIPLLNLWCSPCACMCGKWPALKQMLIDIDIIVKPCVLCNSILWVVYQFNEVDVIKRDSELVGGSNNPINSDVKIQDIDMAGLGREVSIVSKDEFNGRERDIIVQTRCCKSTIDIVNRANHSLIIIHKTDSNALQLKDLSGSLSVGDKAGSLSIKRTGMNTKVSKFQLNKGESHEILARTEMVYITIGRISTDRKSLIILTEEMQVQAGSLVTVNPSLLLKIVAVLPI